MTSDQPIPASQRIPPEGFPTGPAVGERFPDFTLRNQRGEPVNLQAARDGRRALIVFERSIRW